MSRSAAAPPGLRAPFRGSAAVARGLLTKRQLDGPAWRSLFRDIYIRADAVVDHLTLCQAAALLLPPAAALSHRSAAMLYGANVLAPGQPVEATTPPGSGVRSQPGLHAVRSPLPAGDVWRWGGLPVTTAVRTAFDLARGTDLVEAVVAVDALLYRRAVKAASIAGHLDARPGWNGVRRARRVLELARPEVESPMESRLRLVVVLAGLPEPRVQYEVRNTAGHFVARLDLAYDDLRVGLEYDGDHHRERATFQHDAVRLNRLRLLGWSVLRFTADDVLRNPDRVVAQVRAALRR